MIRLFVHTHDEEQPTTVDVSMQTSLKWERRFHRSAPVQLKNDAISLEYMFELAWLELGCPGGDKGFDEWCQTHDVWNYPPAVPDDSGADDESEESETTVDPTREAVTTGSSSNSRAPRASRSGSGAANSSKTNG